MRAKALTLSPRHKSTLVTSWGDMRIRGLRYAVTVATAMAVAVLAPPVLAGCQVGLDPLNTIDRPDKGGRGVRVIDPGMHVFDTSVPCGRASSILDINSAETRFVEVGWFENTGPVYGCVPTTSGAPRQLAFAWFDGAPSCLTTPDSIPGGQWDHFRVQDSNQDGVWGFYHKKDDTWDLIWASPDMDPFVTGFLWSNGERATTDDSARAVFKGLQRMINSTDYRDWAGTFEEDDSDDGGWKDCIVTNTHVKVIPNSESC